MQVDDETIAPVARGPVRFRDGARFSIAVFLCVRIALSLIGVVAAGRVHLPPESVSGGSVTAVPGWHNAIDATDRWDAWWFQHIAVEGYAEHDEGAAFFPGYPLAIRLVMAITPLGSLGAALLVSNVAFLGALIVLYALTAREFDESTARRSVVLLAVFPSSFFFLAPYSESLFLLATLLTFWWARSDRWGPASVAGLMATLTRSFGVLLTPALVVEAWARGREGRTRRLVLACGPLVGAALYAGYWLVRTGDALRPLHAQDTWFRSFEFFVVTLGWAFALAIRGIGDARGIYWTTDLVLTAILLVPLAMRWRRIAPSYLVYAATLALVVLTYTLPDRPLLSDPRLLLVAFPCFWAIATIVRDRWFVVTAVVFAIGYVAAAAVFMNWGFLF
jgi:hypothetical protein